MLLLSSVMVANMLVSNDDTTVETCGMKEPRNFITLRSNLCALRNVELQLAERSRCGKYCRCSDDFSTSLSNIPSKLFNINYIVLR